MSDPTNIVKALKEASWSRLQPHHCQRFFQQNCDIRACNLLSFFVATVSSLLFSGQKQHRPRSSLSGFNGNDKITKVFYTTVSLTSTISRWNERYCPHTTMHSVQTWVRICYSAVEIYHKVHSASQHGQTWHSFSQPHARTHTHTAY